MFAIKRQVTVTLLLIAFAVSPLFVPSSIADNATSPPPHTHTSTTHLAGLVCYNPTFIYGHSTHTGGSCTIVRVCALVYSYESETCSHGAPVPRSIHSCGCPSHVGGTNSCSCPTGRATTCPCETNYLGFAQ